MLEGEALRKTWAFPGLVIRRWLYVLLVAFSSHLLANVAQKQVPQSMNNYQVGRLSTDWPLSSGNSVSTRLQVEWWYPTTDQEGDPDYQFSKDLKTALVTYMGMPSFAISTKEKGAGLRGAQVASGTFPLVVFNHGFASFSRQNNRQAEALAAAGFVVASLSFPQHSLTTEYSTGEVVGIDVQHPGLQFMGKSADKKVVLQQLAVVDATFAQLAQATTAADYQAAINELRNDTMFSLYIGSAESRVDSMVGFIESVLAKTEVAGAERLLQHLNLNQIGIYGHSLGGVVAVAAAQRLQAQGIAIGGVLNLDAPQFMLPEGDSTTLQGNGCFLMGGATKAGRKKMRGTRLNTFLANTNPGFCEINVEGAAHQNFSDLSWVTPLKWFGQLGSVSNKKFGVWLNGFVVSYMSHYLQGTTYDYPMWPDAKVVGNIKRP